MKKITTKDNSITYYNKQYDETYHSKSGAKEESIKKFVKPCEKVIEANDIVKVLDICFGIGYNTAALLDYILTKYPNKKIYITAIEKDIEIINKILENDESGFKNYEIIRELVKNKTEKHNKTYFKYNNNNIKIKLIVDDARETIKQLNNKFNIVFLDAFSPNKCPELWEENFIKDISNNMQNKAILTTYSCARIVRDNLKKAKLSVYDGPCVGRRAPSTIAIKTFV